MQTQKKVSKTTKVEIDGEIQTVENLKPITIDGKIYLSFDTVNSDMFKARIQKRVNALLKAFNSRYGEVISGAKLMPLSMAIQFESDRRQALLEEFLPLFDACRIEHNLDKNKTNISYESMIDYVNGLLNAPINTALQSESMQLLIDSKSKSKSKTVKGKSKTVKGKSKTVKVSKQAVKELID